MGWLPKLKLFMNFGQKVVFDVVWASFKSGILNNFGAKNCVGGGAGRLQN